jgi:glycosyltransferase involved in cell wall biosynthesis
MNICNSKPVISIIVPVYKTEKYLRRCINSILVQTFTDFECILIDDGSPDDCPTICDEYAEKDKRIIAIHQENKGVSAARNVGLDIAKGDWIGFVDSDDWCDEGMFRFLYDNAIKHNADVSICGVREVSSYEFINTNTQKETKLLCNGITATRVMLAGKLFNTSPFAKLMKADIFIKNKIRYDILKCGEDAFLLYTFFKCIDRIFFSSIPYYNYFQHILKRYNTERMMKILYSGFRFPHHSSNGGYDRIAKKPNTTYLADIDIPFGNIKFGTRGKGINLRFLDIMTKFLRYKYDVTHLIYTENQLYYPYPRSRHHKIVGTIHLDIHHKVFSSRLKNTIKTLDAIIVLKKDYVDTVFNKTGVKTVFIPHGFDKPIFQKNISIDTQKINISVIGSNYRDYNTLDFIIKNTINKNVIFHLMNQKQEIVENFRTNNNVLCYNYLNNDSYYSLLSVCDYNFLPLTFGTANNVLLEAQCLGVASILPRISGVLDYAADAQQGNIFYDTKDELLETVNKLRKNSIQEKLIKHSEKFSWSEIFKQLDLFYIDLYRI